MSASESVVARSTAQGVQPVLVWPGKAPVTLPPPIPLVTTEVVTATLGAPLVPAPVAWRNQLICGDNLRAMAALLPDYAGQIALVYIDPPFDTGAEYAQAVRVGDRDAAGASSVVKTPVYRDAWGPGHGAYLQMLYERLTLLHMLLAEGGAIYVHVDPTVGHYVRLILDEIFGAANFQREIVWRIGWVSGFKSAAVNWARNHDTILYYAKGRPAVFNKEYLPYPPGYQRRSGGTRAARGYPIEDVWNASAAEQALKGQASLDSIQIKSFSTEKTGFPTQKNESLLRRIVAASSRPGDLVADFFAGSGTTLAVAEQLGRRWIGCDSARAAIHTTRKRLLRLDVRRGFEVRHCGLPTHHAVAPGRPAAARTQPHRGARIDAHLEAGGVAASVILRRYVPAHGVPDTLVGRRRVAWSDYVDYWAVDFNYDGEVFRVDWAAFRTRRQSRLALQSAPSPHPLADEERVAVQVIDVFGVETLTVRRAADGATPGRTMVRRAGRNSTPDSC